jgi:hypothetical protein
MDRLEKTGLSGVSGVGVLAGGLGSSKLAVLIRSKRSFVSSFNWAS